MNLLLVGPPGAGKGTQAKRISKRYKIPHISTGDLLREAIANETQLGMRAKEYMETGKLVPDPLIMDLLNERLDRDDCRQGYLLDGFPRNRKQAEALDDLLSCRQEKLSAVLLIDVDQKEIIDRITGRRTCRDCGTIYHILQSPSRKEGVCDQCGGNLYQRKDDHEEIIKKRLEVYFEQTLPLIQYYSELKLLDKMNGSGTIDQIFNDICFHLDRRLCGS